MPQVPDRGAIPHLDEGSQSPISALVTNPPGTRGAAIAAGQRFVRIYGEWVPIKAQVANLAMLSAHADADELIRWAAGFNRPPRDVFVVYGEPQPADTLRTRLDREFGWCATVPRPNQRFSL